MNRALLHPQTVLLCVKKIKNPHLFLLDSLNLMKKPYTLKFKDGYSLKVRPKNNKRVGDIHVIKDIILYNQYELKSIPSKGVVIDVGAQIGCFSVPVATNTDCLIISIEPEKTNYEQLKKNKTLNKLKNIKSYNVALTKEKGFSYFYISQENSAGHSLFQDDKKQKYKVKTLSLKDIIDENKIKKIQYLKLDCEGGEYDILLNLSKKYLDKIKTIYLEQHHTPDILNKYAEESITNYLEKNGFNRKLIDKFYFKDEGTFYIFKFEK